MKTSIVSAAEAGHVNRRLAVCESAGATPDEQIVIPAPGRMTGRRDRLPIGWKRRSDWGQADALAMSTISVAT